MSVGERFVLDASVALAWCFEDESSDLADLALDSVSAHLSPGSCHLVSGDRKRLAWR